MSALLSMVRIETNTDGHFEFAPNGESVILTRVHDRHGEVVDFVAWRPDEPGSWWLRRGDETPILGARNLAMAAYYGDPITLHPTPQDWLLAGWKGACIIKWSWPLDDLFEGVGEIWCDSEPLRQKMIAAWRRWEPPVIVRQEVRYAA